MRPLVRMQSTELHKAMVEQSLHGYDVQLSAIHFAATSLAMLNPHIEFDRMNLYVMDYGAGGGKVSLGSLDFLGEDEVPVQFALSPEIALHGAERISGEGPQGIKAGVTQQTLTIERHVQTAAVLHLARA